MEEVGALCDLRREEREKEFPKADTGVFIDRERRFGAWGGLANHSGLRDYEPMTPGTSWCCDPLRMYIALFSSFG
ncbi:hypothetical protein L484_025196 [Morus notabilis]|uniref:Uncharacterized protein n=1 Tax=Morus notabilis TaxID=981085 RepID=W9SIL1_9ROSA|nr:hypothetical protein L484_025196 [Morus notabilis]